jgi:2-oxoglutarate ferredoxin oxidoreductase subunit delta
MIEHKVSVTIDFEQCKGCELCVYYCPKKCIAVSEEFNRAGQHPAKITKPEKCNGCGICYIICPEYAVTIKYF